MKKITEQLMQEKINHQQTKDSALSEEITLGVYVQKYYIFHRSPCVSQFDRP